MDMHNRRDKRTLEIMLLALVLGMTMLFAMMGQHGLLAINLFYLPILVAGYYLGRGAAGVLALFSILIVTVATTWFTPSFGAYDTPLMVGLALTIWAAVLGLVAILVGTLCEERNRNVDELHKAYVGVVEVLFKYLQSSNPNTKARSIRVAELCDQVASKMKLSRKQIDDIRVAALLRDLESVEITTQLVSKAVDALERGPDWTEPYTFQGTDLVHSLGAVLEGALPLIVSQDEDLCNCVPIQHDQQSEQAHVGVKIISTVRSYDALTSGKGGDTSTIAFDALQELRRNTDSDNQEVIEALAQVVRGPSSAKTSEPAHA